MKISNAQKNYIPLLIPIDKPFIKLTPEEAKEYFDWFIMHVGRINDKMIMCFKNNINT